MFGDLITWYLFLGGSGAGMVALLALADLAFWLRSRRAASGRAPAAALAWAADLSPALMARGFSAATLALVLGALCLLADLGRPERFLYVFALPTPSVLTFGSFVLGGTVACSLFLAAVALFRLDRVPRPLIRAVEALAVACGLSTTVYTGVLLSQMGSVPLWNAALPLLFTCSSLSVGVGGVLACQLPFGARAGRLVRTCAHLDLALVVLEALAFALYAALAAAAVGGEAFVGQFLFGSGRCRLWLGFLVPAIVAPFVLELAFLRRGAPSLVAATLPFLMVGGFFLRYCIVNVPLIGVV